MSIIRILKDEITISILHRYCQTAPNHHSLTLMVDQRRILQLLTIIKKNILTNKFDLVDHGRITRHNDGLKIKLPIPRNQFVRHAPFYVGCTFWNNLNIDIRNLKLNQYKTEIKKMLIDGILRPN